MNPISVILYYNENDSLLPTESFCIYEKTV